MVCLLGPRQCGKTTLARTLRPAYGYISLDDTDALALARSDPNGFMAALPDPVILDEIQRAPELLRTIKLSVDRDRRLGRFLLTGSANLLLLPKLGDSLAGRMTVLELHPLTAAELNRAPGGFLAAWLAGRLRPALADEGNLTTLGNELDLGRDELGYRCLGDWSDQPANSNVHEGLLTAALTRAGYVPDQSSRPLHRLRTEADHPQRSLHENNKAVYSLLR